MIPLLFAAVVALQQALVPPGDYMTCVLSEAGSLDGPVPVRFGLRFHDIPNYEHMDQPGLYELRDHKIHWLSGPLRNEAPGDYDPDKKTVRFHSSFSGFPIASQLICAKT